MTRSIGRYLVELLGKNGIDTVFGIPGVHNLELYRGLTASNLRHGLARHAQGGGFAAAPPGHTAEAVRHHLRLCLASLRTGRPRPAYLEIPLDVLAQSTTLEAQRFEGTPLWPQASPDQIDAAVRLL